LATELKNCKNEKEMKNRKVNRIIIAALLFACCVCSLYLAVKFSEGKPWGARR
jgi:hypothetical protein